MFVGVAECPSQAWLSYGALGQEPMAGLEGQNQNSRRLRGVREEVLKVKTEFGKLVLENR